MEGNSGSFGSGGPNLQNIPIKSELGKQIRETMTPPSHKEEPIIDVMDIVAIIAAVL